MDGNRRWAKEKGLPSFEGHRIGYEKMKQVGQWCLDRGISYLTIYAFSTENWDRSAKEVEFIMDLLAKGLTAELPLFQERGLKINIIGSRDKLSEKLKKAIDWAEEATRSNGQGTLNIALNYGGRLEIVEAVKKLMQKGVKASDLTTDLISQNLWTAGQPEPDLIIRTSGEQRLSGFMTWQSVYSELYFTKKYWPAFTEGDLDEAIEEYKRRTRRFGGN